MTTFSNLSTRRAVRVVGGLAALACALIASASIASAATITVTTGLDQYGTGAPGECSLREAIQSANQDSNFDQCMGVGPYGNDVIVFSPTVTLVQLTITTGSTSNDDNSFLDLDIIPLNAIVIDGGPSGVTIQPGISPWTDRIFDIPHVGGQPSPVTLRNLTIQGGGPTLSNETPPLGNPCYESGGGVRNWSGGALTLENVLIQNNAMPQHGGGVCQNNGPLTVLTSTIRNNVAIGFNGGGIYYLGNGTLLVQGSTVLSNTASRSGGGIYDQADTMTIQDSQVLSNSVIGFLGTGGGVRTVGGTSPKQVLSSTVAYNRADGDGGGIYNQTARGLQVFNSTVLSNTAGAFLANPGNGGGIWSGAMLTVANSSVLSNTALFTGTTVPIIPPGGGGIYQQGAPMTIGSSQVAHNRARALSGSSIAGGGIWNSGIATLNNAIVEHNRADGVPPGGQARGGGIHNENDLNLLSNSQVRHNRAEWFSAYGGGVSNESNSPGGSAEFTLSASSVSTNTAQGDPTNGFTFGGGIYNGGNGTADLLAGEVRNNLAASGQFAGGGGVASNNILTVTSSLVISNAATAALGSFGGGIQTAGSAALITDTQIYTNTAGNGGGWYNTVFSAQLNNSDVRFNEAATKDGGGVYNLGNGAQIDNSAICQNQAQQHGGGVYNGAPILIGQTTICLNQAGLGGVGDGGGIYNNGGLQVMMSQVLTNTTVDNGGGIYNASPNSGIFNSTVQSNTASAGGGVYNAAGSMLIDTSTLRTNQAGNDGGGAYNAADMNITASTVQSNTANSLGGGVYNASSATGLLVNVSTLRSNSAPTGGGLYNAATANVSLSALVNNTASTAGGGAHNATGGALSSENNTFSGNSAPNGGGLNVAAGSSAYLTFTTVASNTAGNGINVSFGGTAEVYATLLAYNAGSNCVGGVTDNGSSMSDDGSCTGFAFNNTNPLLQPLALNGGQTLNHALSPGSPALDKVPTAQCTVSNDQRFFVSRPQGTDCDIGAFELEEANLEVSKSADPSPVIAGQTITYTVIVTNVSTSGFANNVVLTDTLLGGTTFGGVVSSGGFTLQSSSSSQAVFTLPSLAANSSATLVFTATAPAGGPITNTVTVASGNPDPVLSNNTASVSTPVIPAAYLAVSKAQDFVPYAPGVVLPGSTVTYTIVVTNTGPSAAPVAIQDTLASGVGFVAAGGSGWSCSFSAPTVTCNHPTPLAAGASASVLITVTAPLASSTVFTNAANGFAGAFPGGPFASNVVTLTTAAQADLNVSKTATPSPVFAGQVVTYVVTVTNTGPDSASNVVITDVFQGGASFGSVITTSGGATFQISTTTAVTFMVTSLGVGNSAVMTYTVVAPADGVITNTATVKSDAVDPQPANNVFSTTTPVTPVANLSISKAPSFPTAIAGTITPSAQLTYTILVTNNGPSPAANVVVTDVLPAGLTFVSATGSGWTCGNSGQTVTCTVSSLSVGAAPAIQIVATAPVTPGLVLTNTAVVNAATHPNTPVNSNSVSVKVQFRAFLPIVRRP